MALDTATLKLSLIDALTKLQGYDGTPGKTQDDAIEELTEDISAAIEIFVKSGTVTTEVASGIAVQVAPATGTGTTVGTGTGIGSVE